jgi:predicted CopG family antitoxin
MVLVARLIKVSDENYRKLELLKIHPRQSFDEVIEKLIEYFKAGEP